MLACMSVCISITESIDHNSIMLIDWESVIYHNDVQFWNEKKSLILLRLAWMNEVCCKKSIIFSKFSTKTNSVNVVYSWKWKKNEMKTCETGQNIWLWISYFDLFFEWPDLRYENQLVVISRHTEYPFFSPEINFTCFLL